MVNESLYADEVVLMNKAMEYLKERLWNWRNGLESKGVKVIIRKTKVMVSGSAGVLFKSKRDPCEVCESRVMANLVLCTESVIWVHGRCAKI